MVPKNLQSFLFKKKTSIEPLFQKIKQWRICLVTLSYLPRISMVLQKLWKSKKVCQKKLTNVKISINKAIQQCDFLLCSLSLSVNESQELPPKGHRMPFKKKYCRFLQQTTFQLKYIVRVSHKINLQSTYLVKMCTFWKH